MTDTLSKDQGPSPLTRPPAEASGLRSAIMVVGARHNLGAPISSFVGRGEELTEVRALLDRHRLVTLTGVGGCGKSRLADAVCRQLLETEERTRRDGVWWVDLGALADPDEVADACLSVHGLRREPDRDPVDTLSTRLADAHLLICLDTCEHVLDAVAEIADRLLRSAAGVRLLTTSREPLGVPGEAVCRVPSLSPRDAVELFSERAQLAAGPVPEGLGDDVAAICARVDRLPLAIELAAGWTRILSPRQLLEGLDDRFRLLTGGSRRAVPRHQALLASIAWSHDLLTEPEQVVFRRLAAFSGFFDLDGATAVAGDPAADDDHIVEMLGRLVDKSLVVCEQAGREIRYRLLDSVRHYGEDRLTAAGELLEVRDRHLVWCAARAEAAATEPADYDSWLAGTDALGDNVKAALEWGLGDPTARGDLARRLAAAMVMPWFLTGRTHEGLGAARRALTPERDDVLHERLITGTGLIEMISGPVWRHLTSGQIAPERFTDPVARARSLLVDGFVTFFADHAACEQRALEAGAAAEVAHDEFCRDFSRIMAAFSLTARDRHAEAIEVARPALVSSRRRRDRFCTGFALCIEQYGAMQRGDLRRSVSLGQEMVEVVAPLGDYFAIGTLTSNFALALTLAGQASTARAIMRPIVQSVQTAPDVDVVGFQVAMGHISLHDGEWEEALHWFQRGLRRLDLTPVDWTAARSVAGAVEALRRLGRVREATELLDRGEDLAAAFDSPQLRADLDSQRAFLMAASDPAAAFDLHHAALKVRRAAGLGVFQPDSLDALVALTSDDSPTEQAARLLAASSAARTTMSRPRTKVAEAEHEGVVQLLETALGSEAFGRAWEQGSALSLDEAVALAQRSRGSRERPRSGWNSLTPTEIEVVHLVADGLSNTAIGERLFMSRSTVKTHLAHVFAKLGVNNRVAVAAVVTSRHASQDRPTRPSPGHPPRQHSDPGPT